VKAREEEGDEAAPVRGSPELGWWQRGGVTVVEDGGRKLRVAWALERERAVGGCAGWSGGETPLFIGAGRHSGGGC
jgi:hypothetical protein